MNAILYHSNSHKKINGTLFYCFEYFIFLKQYLPDIKYFLINTDLDDLELFKSVFREKYTFDDSFLDDIIPLKKYTDFLRLPVENLMVLDVNSYGKLSPFTGKVKSIRVYSNDNHKFLNKKSSHTFYGWYEYQDYNKPTRLKLYKDIHRTYETTGDKTFISSPLTDCMSIIDRVGLDEKDVFIKQGNAHNASLFESINKIIYWHTGKDTNNRIVVEAYIHDIPLQVYYNGYLNDSIKERCDVIESGNIEDLFLDDTDIMIKDFVNDCKN